jgi:hypothetical protein
MSGNFLPLAFIDPFDLIASLPRRMGLFKEGRINIRWGLDPNFHQADLAKWPDLQSVLNQIERFGEQQGGIEFGRIHIELLNPDTCLPWERDDSPYAERFNRLVLALRTNPGVMHYSGTESLHLVPGVVTWANQRAWHSMVNLGETNAIHLIVDTRKRDQA